MSSGKEKSIIWYALPLIFSIFGALAAYYFLKNDDPVKAKNCLKIGIVLVIFYVGYYVVFSLMLETFEFS